MYFVVKTKMKKQVKYVFITGGVVSSLGKGITSASLALLLKSRGYKVFMQKLDPYLNVDPGTMSPYQHGEVFVTDDGAETDLDLGHYERFAGVSCTKASNYTSGRIYSAVLSRERAGGYLGGTVQVVPHITDEIKAAIRSGGSQLAATADAQERVPPDIVLCEIGGVSGDIESLPFLEAARQFRFEEGSENTCFVHLTLVPYLKAAGELKTKPSQHSVGQLRAIGIIPDILVCRTEMTIPQEHLDKLAMFCNVKRECVIEEKDVTDSVYAVPRELRYGVGHARAEGDAAEEEVPHRARRQVHRHPRRLQINPRGPSARGHGEGLQGRGCTDRSRGTSRGKGRVAACCDRMRTQ